MYDVWVMDLGGMNTDTCMHWDGVIDYGNSATRLTNRHCI